jgi:hypothetical protein
MPDAQPVSDESIAAAYDRGRRVGLATAALALSVVAYINLFGIEKSLLAIALGVAAIKGVTLSNAARTRTLMAFALASVHAITVIVIAVVYADKLADFARRVLELYHSLS